MDVRECAHGVNQVSTQLQRSGPCTSLLTSSPARLCHFDATRQEQTHRVSENGRDLIRQTTHQYEISLQEANWLAVFTRDTTANKLPFFSLIKLSKF